MAVEMWDLLDAASDAVAVMDACAEQIDTAEYLHPREMHATAEQLRHFAANLRKAMGRDE